MNRINFLISTRRDFRYEIHVEIQFNSLTAFVLRARAQNHAHTGTKYHTHTHARTRTGTRTQLRCALGKFVWRKMLERWQPLSTIEIHMFHVQSEEANWINVAACIAVSCCPALSASCLVEQEAALLRLSRALAAYAAYA